jgi:hypothetical protein
VFDLSNQKTIANLHTMVMTGLQGVQMSQDKRAKGDFEEGSGPDLLQSTPVLVVGCKKDLLEESKHQNGKVLDILKRLDQSKTIDYIEVGLSQHRSVYRVP